MVRQGWGEEARRSSLSDQPMTRLGNEETKQCSDPGSHQPLRNLSDSTSLTNLRQLGMLNHRVGPDLECQGRFHPTLQACCYQLAKLDKDIKLELEDKAGKLDKDIKLELED